MATVEEYHAFFETLWRGAEMDEQEARRALRKWVKEHDFTLYDMGLTMYEYHDEDEEGEEEYEPEQWEREKARREELRIYEQHVGLLGDYINLELSRRNWESLQKCSSLPAWKLVRIGSRENPRDWESRWAVAWEKVNGEGASKDEMVALTSSPIWRELSVFDLPYPPFDYNSGMDVLSVDAEEAAQLGLVRDEEVPRLEEDDDFGVKKELPESEHGADLREIEEWIAAAESYLSTPLVNRSATLQLEVNSESGGEDCRAKSVETCRCKGMPESESGADLSEIELWIKEMEAEIAAEDARMRAEGIIKK